MGKSTESLCLHRAVHRPFMNAFIKAEASNTSLLILITKGLYISGTQDEMRNVSLSNSRIALILDARSYALIVPRPYSVALDASALMPRRSMEHRLVKLERYSRTSSL